MKIKVIEPGGFRDGGDFFAEGDQRTVADERGKVFVGTGWAEDMDGNVPTGERDLTPRAIDPKRLVSTI